MRDGKWITLLCLALLLYAAPASVHAVEKNQEKSSTLPWVERYQRALEVDPDNAALRYQLGLSLLSANEYSAAIEEFHRAYPSLSQTVGINFNLGLAYTHLRDPDSALLYLEQAEASGAAQQHEIYPLASALYNVALIYLDQGERDAAIEVLRHVVELAPERRDLMRLYGEILFQAGRTAEAQKQLLRYLDIYPDDEQVRETLFALHYNRGLEKVETEDVDAARKAFERALSVAPGSPMALYYLAYIDYRKNQPGRVVEHLAEAVAEFPEDIQRSSFPLLFNSSRQLLQQQELVLAERGVAPLVELSAGAAKYLGLAGEIALAREDFAAARHHYARILEGEPAHPEALRSLALAEKELARVYTDEGQELYRQGELLAAYRRFTMARELDPVAPRLTAYLRDTGKKLAAGSDVEFDKAEEAIASGDSILALRHVREGRKLWPEASRGETLEAQLLDGLELEIARQLMEGQSLLALKEYPRAIEAFSMLLEIDPGNEDALSGYDQAKQAIEEYLEQQLAAGFEALEAGDLDAADTAFQSVLSQRPANANALEGFQRISALRDAMVGDLLQWARRAFSEGDYASAREHFQKVLSQYDTPSLRNEYLAFESTVEKRLAALLGEARNARAQNDYREALRFYRQARKVAADPESLSAELDETLREADETMLSLLVQAREALDEGAAGQSVKLLRGVLKIEPSQAQALELLKRARAEAREQALALYDAGRRQQKSGKLETARTSYASALDVDPYLQVAREALDAVDMENRKLSEALIERLYLEGVALYTRGSYDLAIAKWQQVLKLQVDHEKSIRNLEKAERKMKQLKGRS